MSSENVWSWLQRKGKLFKVISNSTKGTIEVLNENGEILIKKTNLSRKQVEIVEKKFLNFVAKKLNGSNKLKPDEIFDPMVT